MMNSGIRKSNGTANRLGRVAALAMVALPVLAALAWQTSTSTRALAAQSTGDGEFADRLTVDEHPLPTSDDSRHLADGDFETGSDAASGEALVNADKAYAVVCCGMPSRDSCMYYVGQSQCPTGTTQLACPCRLSKD